MYRINMIAANPIIEEYYNFVNNKDFVCIAAKAALAQQHIKCLVVDHMACPKDDQAILEFMYDFVDEFRLSTPLYHSAAVIFRGPVCYNEIMFDELLWQRLQSLADLDKQHYAYDKRVSSDPSAAGFSFSLKEEAFFIIGLHPGSSRLTRQFGYPTIVFNAHIQFEKLRETNRYQRMKEVVRNRDKALSGTVNPMLDDFGQSSEVYQYSGRAYNGAWKCPLNITHDTEHHSTS